MKEFKGTKGKWEVNEYHDGDLIGISVESNLEGSTIFDTGSCGWIDDEDVANAKLIAAAPEMLEACKKGLEMCIKLQVPTEQELHDMSIMFKELLTKILD